MNYRHAFHAGNFADVFKHALLARALVHLAAKPTPLLYLDTHAGRGSYDLSADAPSRTLEWRFGLARACAALETAPPEVARLLVPWRDAVGALDADGRPVAPYPGSPSLAARLLRPQDRIVACELHPEDGAALAAVLRGDRRAQVRADDGYRALGALVPPPERRGLVLVDPPFEATDEFAAMERAVLRAHRKWPTGAYLLWHPLKDRVAADALARTVLAASPKRLVRATLDVGPGEGLRATGLLTINPPFTFADEARVILPFLARAMGAPGAWTCEILADA
ncbi:MAG: 23S rRNA (adenine(2030)-N(6))-methyltransferase RlmJ [Hyphomicrobiales bacterium]|nr:23S rRNA (adenine(2030)-N(6))-methyltransferase RlmJ [Hyphomicrobiales bacterium]